MTFRQGIIEYIKQNATPADKFDHQPRLYALTRRIGGGLTYDDDVVFAAGWLHDLGVFMGHRPEDPAELAAWDNVEYACRKTPEVLKGVGFPEAKIHAVVEAIRTHQPGANPANFEGILLRDADILEQLGAVAIVRALVKVGRDTRYPTHHEVIPVLQRALENLPGQLRLEKSRQIAQPKIEALEAFLGSLMQEEQ